MNEILDSAIVKVRVSKAAFCKFITANDAGATGSHQRGFYVPIQTWPLLFDREGVKGSNMERDVEIMWQNDFSTKSHFKYYGVGTRNEYRITNFGRNFPFLEDSHVGDLLIIARVDNEEYYGYVLSSDDDIETFFATFNISSATTNQLIDTAHLRLPGIQLEECFNQFVANLRGEYPSTIEMSRRAREGYNALHKLDDDRKISENCDNLLCSWIEAEYLLFRKVEGHWDAKHRPDNMTTEQLIEYANKLTNRRRSRAGKSLEHHLAAVFKASDLKFEEQMTTENNEKPDFIFPGSQEYHCFEFPAEGLTMLGAKTTCKDRWRQVLNEAARIDHKYLFTLQQGISRNQLKEMKECNLTLVVPHKYKTFYDRSFWDDIESLGSFVQKVSDKQKNYSKYYII